MKKNKYNFIIFAVIVVALIVLTIKRKAVFEAINKIIRKNQQNAPIIVRKASPFVYHSVRLGCKCFARKLKYSLTAETEVKGPCIVLCSHGSFLDFIYSGFILQKQKLCTAERQRRIDYQRCSQIRSRHRGVACCLQYP